MKSNDLEFQYLVLSRAERAALEEISRRPQKADALDQAVLKRLTDLNLVEDNWVALTGDPAIDADSDIVVTERGSNFLMWSANSKYYRRIDNIRYIITTAISVAAMLIAGIALLSELGLIKLR